MRLRHILLIALLLAGVATQAQTRKLAHRSHAGNPNTFAMLMDDDHGGGPFPEKVQEVYYLEPWIIKIRKHYEEVAKQNGSPVEVKTDPKATPEKSVEPQKAPKDSLQEKSKQKPKSNEANGLRSNAPVPQPTSMAAAAIPHVRLAKAAVTSTSASTANLWWLAGLIIACVAPCIVLLSGGLKRKSN